MFENRVLRRMFGYKRDKIRRDWRKLRNEELIFFIFMDPCIAV
jgi:hypothetical protein